MSEDDELEVDGVIYSEDEDSDFDDQIYPMLRELENESDRGAALIGAAFIEEALGELLQGVMVDDRKAVKDLLGRSLSNFSARIALANCLGLLDSDIYEDLGLIRDIRNRFAHRHHVVSFQDEEITKQCFKLRTIERLPPIPPDFGWTGSARDRYAFAVNLISYKLKEMPKTLTRPEKRPAPPRSPGWDNPPEYPEN